MVSFGLMDLGCLVETIDRNSGLICGDDEFLYEYKIDTAQKLTKDKITPSKHFFP